MKKCISFLVAFAMIISTVVVPISVSAEMDIWDGTTVDAVFDGQGTESNPYLITSDINLL